MPVPLLTVAGMLAAVLSHAAELAAGASLVTETLLWSAAWWLDFAMRPASSMQPVSVYQNCSADVSLPTQLAEWLWQGGFNIAWQCNVTHSGT